MNDTNKFWKRFEKTGRVEDYLEYACTMEEPFNDAYDDEDNLYEEDMTIHDARDCDGSGSFIAKYW